MPTTDRSQTERIRRIRSTIQAVRRTECPTCPEEGPQGPTDQSTWLSRRFGQMTYYTQTASGATVDKSCCTESSPNIFIITACNQTQTFTGVNIGDFITFINNSPDSVIIIYLNTVSQINVSTFSILVPTAEVSTIVDITD